MKKIFKKFSHLIIVLIFIIVLFFSISIVILDHYNINPLTELLDKNNQSNENLTDTEDENNNSNIIVSGELTIAFLETGNKYTGDAIYIKAGEKDILIDAGSRNSSSETISNFLNTYMTDSKLEYVIATHAHQDHIAGFVGTSTSPGIFERYDCEIIIDFPQTNATSKVYNDYITLRDKEISEGAIHYTALECFNNENGAKRIYDLTEDIKLEFLYNYYYDHATSNENNFSVCTLIHHGNRKFLLTGDLEDEGEKYLVQYNELSKVDLYKAGHHGSYTAGSEELLSVIKPDIVCICCCAGSDEYTKNPDNMFPAQDFISRICKYTDKVYVTTVIKNDGNFESLNGNIVVSSNSTGILVNCSNNNTILKETKWFKENRKWE